MMILDMSELARLGAEFDAELDYLDALEVAQHLRDTFGNGALNAAQREMLDL